MVSMSGCAKESTKKKESLSVSENNTSSVETVDKNTKMDTRYRLNTKLRFFRYATILQ